MKKILLAAAVLSLLQSCSNSQNQTLVTPDTTAQISSSSSKSLDNPDFVRKMQNPAKYKVNTNNKNSICGTNDLQQVNSYDGKLGQTVEYLKAHKDPVGAMESGNKDTSDKFCTGTLISEDLFITASHCIDDSTPKTQYVAFNYERAKGSTSLLKQSHFKITEVVEDHTNGLDYAIIKLDGKPGNTFGWTKVKPVLPEVGTQLSIIQHPSGEPKQFEVGNMAGVEGNYLTYTELDTEPGSSGSGVLDDDGNIVAIHTNGGCTSSGGANRGVIMAEIGKVSKTVQTLSSRPAKASKK